MASTYVLAACAVVLTIMLLTQVVARRHGSIPMWRRRMVIGTLLLDLLSLVIAQRAWAAYQPYSRLGLSPYASFWLWQGRLGGPESAYVAQTAFTFEVAATFIVIMTAILLWMRVRQARIVASPGVNAHVNVNSALR